MAASELVVAIDPGTEKCGVAVVGPNRAYLQQVVNRVELIEALRNILQTWLICLVVIGDRTGSKDFEKEIRASFPELKIHLVDEHLSSQEARLRYWEHNPPRGLRRLIPTTMQVPPEPFDDYVAVILGERYFQGNE